MQAVLEPVFLLVEIENGELSSLSSLTWRLSRAGRGYIGHAVPSWMAVLPGRWLLRRCSAVAAPARHRKSFLYTTETDRRFLQMYTCRFAPGQTKMKT